MKCHTLWHYLAPPAAWAKSGKWIAYSAEQVAKRRAARWVLTTVCAAGASGVGVGIGQAIGPGGPQGQVGGPAGNPMAIPAPPPIAHTAPIPYTLASPQPTPVSEPTTALLLCSTLVLLAFSLSLKRKPSK